MSDRVTFRKMIQATVLLMAAGISYAGTIVDLAPEADAILVGSITSRMESNEIVSFTITVDRILKGQSIPTVIHVEHPWQRKFSVSPSGSVTIEQGLRGIWFLRHLNPNGWDALGANGLDGLFHSLYWPAVKVLPEQYQYPPGTSLNDALTFETAAGAQVSGNPEVLLYAVDSLSSPAVETVLTSLLRASTGQVRWVALAGLLGRAQAGSLGKVLQEWPAISQDAQSKSYVLGAMDTDFRPEEPEAVHEVVALAQANTTPRELRTALAKVLLAVHTRETLPYFAGLLHSTQLKDRMTGVFGMACFANGNPTQSPATAKSLAHLTSPTSAPYQTPNTEHLGAHGILRGRNCGIRGGAGFFLDILVERAPENSLKLDHNLMRLLLVVLLVFPAFAQSPSARLINATRPGHDFQIGDRFEILITGAPQNKPVSVRTTTNGRTDWGPIIGLTDIDGRWSTTGKFERADFGDWSEVWTVGGKTANPIIQFSVNAPCSKEGKMSAIVMNRHTSLTCDTAEGRQTFVTQSYSLPFRTPDGRAIPARVRAELTAEQYQEETMEYFITRRDAQNASSGRRPVARQRGDAAAALITKIIGPNALSEDEILNVVSVIRGAFKRREVIASSELNPSKTLLLLSALSSSNDPEGLQRQIAETIAYVRTQTSH